MNDEEKAIAKALHEIRFMLGVVAIAILITALTVLAAHFLIH
jgi:hypothetical protein